MYKNLWSKLSPGQKNIAIYECITAMRPSIEYLLDQSNTKRHVFNYVLDCYDFKCLDLYDNGVKFASADLDLFETPADLMEFIINSINIMFYDYIIPEENPKIETYNHEVKTVRELLAGIKEEPYE